MPTLVLSDTPYSSEATLNQRRPVVGSVVASWEFTAQLLDHTSFDRVVCCTEPGMVEALQASLQLRLRHRGPEFLCVVTRREAAGVLRSEKCEILHNPGGPIGLEQGIYLRHQFGRPQMPVTALTHALSFRALTEWMTAYILARPHRYDALICSSTDAAHSLQELLGLLAERLAHAVGAPIDCPCQVHTIPLGVDTSRFRPRDRNEARNLLGLPSDRPIVLNCGRFSPYDKADLFILVRAVAALRHLPFPVLLAGDNSRCNYAAEVNQLANSMGLGDRFAYRPDFSDVTRPLLYSAADLFVSLSDSVQEAFGLTVLEAMSSGIPVVVSDWAGYRDLVPDGEVGFRIPTCTSCYFQAEDMSAFTWPLEDHLLLAQTTAVDVDITTDRLRVLLQNPGLRQEMGEAGRRRAVTVYDWPAVIRAYEAMWRYLSADAKRSAGSDVRGRAPGHLTVPYGRLFANSPTRCVSDDAEIRITSSGRDVLKRQQPPPMFSRMRSFLPPDALYLALAALRRAGRARLGMSIGDLRALLMQKERLEHDGAGRIIWWLIKNGFVELAQRVTLADHAPPQSSPGVTFSSS